VIEIGTTLNGRFTLERELGRGGMGAVYRATDQVLGRAVAIKTLKDGGGDVGPKIRLEAQILARLLHDNVVRLYDFGESEGVYFLVMEEVDGSSFSKRWRQLSLAERLRVAAQVAGALDYAHHQGVIHRDVKPANVLLTAGDQAKLSDFGLSTTAGQAEQGGTIRGTPQYMSPEQSRGLRLDHRTDLYSLGVMLYECATGSVPFVGPALSVIAQHASAAPVPPRQKDPAVPPGLDALITALLAKDPAARPASGAAVAQALRDEIAALAADPRSAAVAVAAPAVAAPAAATPAVAVAVAPKSASAETVKHVEPAPPLASPLAREMVEAVVAEPLILSADARYLCGHYLAFLLGGARRQGVLLRRPLDPRNADRARVVLTMAWLMKVGPGEGGENVGRAAELLDTRPEVRPGLNPVAVMKYMAARETPLRRKRFRQARRLLLGASEYARKSLTDAQGVLNPGLIPQALEDLRRVAPARTEVDDELVGRWNRVAEVWRDDPDFRRAVLKYATNGADLDPASAGLWPEVVYPLIERARWQRSFRPRHEQLWDYVSAHVLRAPDAGVRLDRMILRSVPARLTDRLDEDLAGFADEPRLDFDDEAPGAADDEDREAGRLTLGAGVRVEDLAAAGPKPAPTGLVRLAPPEPYRFSQGDLRALWAEAMSSLGRPAAKPGAGAAEGVRSVTIGPYRLAVIPSVRGRSAGQVALQGMGNKQIELLTPSIRAGGTGSKPLIAVWVYQDGSLAVAHLDFKGVERYILWHAPNAQQSNHDTHADLDAMLDTLGMEPPDQLDRVLTKHFRPAKPA